MTECDRRSAQDGRRDNSSSENGQNESPQSRRDARDLRESRLTVVLGCAGLATGILITY
jgi:hypothetical protein